MLQAKAGCGPTLEHTYRWLEHAPVLELHTDACPTGIGGVLCAAFKPIAYFSHQLSREDCSLLGARGDPAFQSEYELYAILIAVLLFHELSRGLGGASKSEEMRLEWLSSLPDTARDDARLPRGGALVWAFGVRFILREVELASIVISDLSFDWLAKHVTLVVPVSKTDTRAAGCRRTLACCKPASRDECEGPTCPFCVAVRAMRSQCELTGLAASMDVAQEVPLFGQQGGPFSVVEKEMVIEAAKQDAAWFVEAVPEASVMNPAQITGHFMRRSGCKRLAREGHKALGSTQRVSCGWLHTQKKVHSIDHGSPDFLGDNLFNALRISKRGAKVLSFNSSLHARVDVPFSPCPLLLRRRLAFDQRLLFCLAVLICS